MERVVIEELLDSDQGLPEEVAESLSDIHRINEWFGGVAASVEMVQRVAEETGKASFDYLESAAGSGDSIRSICRRLERRRIELRLTLADRALTHLPESKRVVVADALQLPFPDNSFDIVGCTLFTHHLNPSEVIQFVNESLRVARFAVLNNDLIRGPVELALAYASNLLHRSHISRHDGIASVRRAYTLSEMLTMLRSSNAARINIRRRYVYRMAAIAWKA